MFETTIKVLIISASIELLSSPVLSAHDANNPELVYYHREGWDT